MFKKSLILSAILACVVMFSSCKKEDIMEQQKLTQTQVNGSHSEVTKSGWVMQTWNFSVLNLSKTFQVGNKGLVVSGSNNSSAGVIVYIQQRDISNNVLIENTFTMAPYGTGIFSTATPEIGISKVVLTVVRTSGGLNPQGVIYLDSKY